MIGLRFQKHENFRMSILFVFFKKGTIYRQDVNTDFLENLDILFFCIAFLQYLFIYWILKSVTKIRMKYWLKILKKIILKMLHFHWDLNTIQLKAVIAVV
jgi:hypothetical protein